MITINTRLNGHELILVNAPELASDSVKFDRVHFDFDSSWDGYNSVALFWGTESDEPYASVVDGDGYAVIPLEVLSEKSTIRFGVYGENSNALLPRVTSTIVKYKIKEGAWSDAISNRGEATEDMVEQLQLVAYAALNKATELSRTATVAADDIVSSSNAAQSAAESAEQSASLTSDKAAAAAKDAESALASLKTVANTMDERASAVEKTVAELVANGAPFHRETVWEVSDDSKLVVRGDSFTSLEDLLGFDYLEIHRAYGSVQFQVPDEYMDVAFPRNTVAGESTIQHECTSFLIALGNHVMTVSRSWVTIENSDGTLSYRELTSADTGITKVIGWKLKPNVDSDGFEAKDDELIDLRVAASGETYESAGEAVRSQIEELDSSKVDAPSVVSGPDGYLLGSNGDGTNKWVAPSTITDDTIMVSKTKPLKPENKLWIQPSTAELKVPSWAEHEQLRHNLESADAALQQKMIAKPADSPNGESGQLLRTLGDGRTEWSDVGTPTDEQTSTAVTAWLNAHPEATTTVQDGSLTEEKFNSDYGRMLNTFTADSLSAVISGRYPAGHYVRTLGFSAPNDNGSGLYYIESASSGLVADNCSIFLADNGTFVRRVFDAPFVYLESLNFLDQDVSMDTINAVIAANGIEDVRCGDIETDKTIVVDGYNLRFGHIHYTGTDMAVLIDSLQYHSIDGDEITADNEFGGNGLTVTCSTRNCLYNHVNIRHIYSSRHCVDILPVNGHGIMRNTFLFGGLDANPVLFNQTTVPVDQRNRMGDDIIGLNIRINNDEKPDGSLYYSWEGEDYFEIGNIKAFNIYPYGSNGDARALSMVLETTTYIEDGVEKNYTTSGTITGLTFGRLAVEYSDIGIFMRCGVDNSYHMVPNQEPGIKSIMINEMRCRESGRTKNFLDCEGWIQDVYIKPTSPLLYTRWSCVRNTSMSRMIIDGPVVAGMAGYRNSLAVGYCLVAVDGITYIRDRMPSDLLVYPDTLPDIPATAMTVSFVDVEDEEASDYWIGNFPTQAASKGLMMPDRFVIRDDLAGTSIAQNLVRLRLEAITTSSNLYSAILRGYFYNESACGLRFSVPRYTTVQIRFARGDYEYCEISNTTGSRHQYLVSAYRRNGTRDNSYTIAQID